MEGQNDEVKKVVIEFTGDQIPELGILCDVALKAAGMKVLKISSYIQDQVITQVKAPKPSATKNGQEKAKA